MRRTKKKGRSQKAGRVKYDVRKERREDGKKGQEKGKDMKKYIKEEGRENEW